MRRRIGDDPEHQLPPDGWSVARQWIGLGVALGGLAWLVSAGIKLGQIHERVTQGSAIDEQLSRELRDHERDATKAFSDIAKIASAIDSRVSRLEGAREERRDRERQ